LILALNLVLTIVSQGLLFLLQLCTQLYYGYYTTAVVVSGYHGMRAPTKFSTGTFVRRGMVVGMVVGMTTRIPRYSCTTRESEE
jgi:hypothetical protein